MNGNFDAKPLVHLADFQPRPKFMAAWERQRQGLAHPVVEFVAEATGTFLYTFAGVGSTASWVLGNLLGIPGLGSLFQIGVAYAVGIMLALVVCMPTSRGHFNCAFTVGAVLIGACTPIRGLRLIVAQIVGAYVACLLIYVQYHNLIAPAEELLIAKDLYATEMFTSTGPAGIFAFYAAPTAKLGNVFLNEFVCDFVIGLVIFAVIEPTNHFCPPAMMPWIIALTYAIVAWGYSPATIAANSARDLGGRLAAITLWGLPAAGGLYAAIAALTNIPATLLAGVFYEFILKDSTRTITPSNQEWLLAERAHKERIKGSMADDASGSAFSEEKIEAGLPLA
ncbi:aquaporin-like protein [Amylocystis lapponica]|nr:aquaporin-like protein [Amylocystis lapponica]